MSIDVFPAELQQFIQGQIDSGEFSSVDEFAVAAAELYRQGQHRHAELRGQVQAAIHEADSGKGVDISDPGAREALLVQIKTEGRARLTAGE